MNKWLFCVLSLVFSFPAQAQLPFFAPETPETAAPLVPESDVVKWMQSLRTAKANAEKAQEKGDVAARDAAIAEAVQWAKQICEPSSVIELNRKKALILLGDLAHEMIPWGASFDKNKLVMVDVRASRLIMAAKGAELAQLLIYKADIQTAKGYGVLAFQDYIRLQDIPEADPALLKYALQMAIDNVPPIDRGQARPLYKKLFSLILTPEERAEWQLKNQVFIITTGAAGAELDAALAAVKTAASDPKTPLIKRDELGSAYANYYRDERALPLIEEMVLATAKDTALGPKWLSMRGDMQAKTGKWKEAAADYTAASKLAPAGSLPSDTYFQTATLINANQLEATPTSLRPAFERIANSKSLSADDKYDAALQLYSMDFQFKDWPGAKKDILLARTIAGTDQWMLAKANNELARVESEAGNLEEALAAWKATNFSKLLDGGDEEKKSVRQNIALMTVVLYQAAIQAKRLAVAQNVVDYSTENSMLVYRDTLLIKYDLSVQQEHYDDAIAIMKKMDEQTADPAEKKQIADQIAGLEKLKADKAQVRL